MNTNYRNCIDSNHETKTHLNETPLYVASLAGIINDCSRTESID